LSFANDLLTELSAYALVRISKAGSNSSAGGQADESKADMDHKLDVSRSCHFYVACK